jgi:D-amino-acid oxidase
MGKRNIDRRRFFKAATATGAASLALTIPAFGKFSYPVSKFDDPGIRPVNVSPDRVIRTVVGFRPYRPSGFVLKTEKIGSKLIVHNYGHGGGGISLSWGTATLAVEKVLSFKEPEIAVIGCGVIGLSTARLLQRKGYQVTIYSKDLPPDTTSNIAGALWEPVSVYEETLVGSDFLTLFNQASKISHRIFQDYVGDKYGVRWIRNYFLGYPFDFPGGKELYPGFREHNNPEAYFGYEKAQEINTMLIEPPIYLPALLQDFLLAGGNIKVRNFESVQDVVQLTEKIIMNCTGLGSKKLFNDTELVPVKGQLSVLLPQPEIDYAYVAPSPDNLLYMFPRKDGIILGGTTDKGNWSLEPNRKEGDRILREHSRLASALPK